MLHKIQNKKEKAKKTVSKEKVRGDILKILKQPLEEKTKEAEENKVLAQRIKAEFDNYKKRILNDYDEKIKIANESLIRRLLTVIDNFDRALNVEKIEDEKFESFYNGVVLINKQIKDILAEYELKAIYPEKREKFNPAIHEAVMVQEINDVKEDVILEVLEKGYMLSNKLLRAAKVKVGKSVKGDS